MTLAAVAPDNTWLDDYVARGFNLVFWPAYLGKGPHEEGWQRKEFQRGDWREGFNVGVKTGTALGPECYLADVDFDWEPVQPFVARLLADTGFSFGRTSKRVSHCFYTTAKPVVTRSFDDLNGEHIVEIRGVKRDGTVGFQTMVPPSLHPTDGRLQMRSAGEITHVQDLERRVLLYAIGCLLLRYLGPRGCGHDMRLAIAGLLLGGKLTALETISILEGLAVAAGNRDIDDVARAVRSTEEQIRSNKRATRGRRVAHAIGEEGQAVVARIQQWLSEGDGPGEDDITVEGGRVTEIVDRVEAALLGSHVPIYQRGGALIRPVRLDVAVGDAVRRAAGSMMLQPVREPWLLEQMGAERRWFRGTTQIDPPPIYGRTLLGRGEWGFPVLRAIVSAPTLGRDGRIIEAPGFDADSGLLLVLALGTFPPVPCSPTKDDAADALARLVHPLREFPFVDKASKSVAVAAFLTALVRPSLRTAPMIGFDAPTAGSGKSILAEGVGIVAMGVRPPALSQGKTDEEDEKRLATVLFAGDPLLHVDNVERAISGDFLCSMLSQEIVQARILGLSERRVLPSTALVLASGNNLSFSGDVSRRVVVCRLDAKVERPDTRRFDFDFHAELLADRASLVIAGLTVLRAYVVAGRPERLTPMGSFADFDWIRGALVWLGCADPADTRAAILDADPKRDELAEVLVLWRGAFGNIEAEVATIAGGDMSGVVALRDKLTEVACRGAWSGKSVGWWLRRHKDRVVRGMCLRAVEGGTNGQNWRVEGEDSSLPFEGSR